MSGETDLFGEEIKPEKVKERAPEPVRVQKPGDVFNHRPYRIFKETKLITWIMFDDAKKPCIPE